MASETERRDAGRTGSGGPDGGGMPGGGGTYRTLAEQAGRISETEERFERRRRDVGLVAGPLVFLLVFLLPLALEQNQHTLGAILPCVGTWWVAEAIPIPITARLGVSLCVRLE